MPDRTYAPSFYTEDPDRYKPEGLYPLCIHDTLHGDRYRIVHKLGSGSFATVWLARDNQENRYVSLKVLSSSSFRKIKEFEILHRIASAELDHPGRRFVAHLLDDFIIESPNGLHRCLVTEVAGQRLSHKPGNAMGSLDQVRTTGRQIAQRLGFLHAIGIAHGDCYSSNILERLTNFDNWTEEQIYETMGHPIKHEVRRMDCEPFGANAPPYTVRPGNVSALSTQLATDEIVLIDFGEAFYHHEWPGEITTPAPYAAPEICFGTAITPAIDKWAFACILYELAADHSLFKLIFGWFNDTLKDQVAMLGKPPEYMWKLWTGRTRYYHEDGTLKETEGWRLNVHQNSLQHRVRLIGRPLEERGYETHKDAAEPLPRELQSFFDLLKSLLVYEPEMRPTFEEVEAHAFFSEGGGTSDL